MGMSTLCNNCMQYNHLLDGHISCIQAFSKRLVINSFRGGHVRHAGGGPKFTDSDGGEIENVEYIKHKV